MASSPRIKVRWNKQEYPRLCYREKADGTKRFYGRVAGSRRWDPRPFEGITEIPDAIAAFKQADADDTPVAPSAVTGQQLYDIVKAEREALDPKEKTYWSPGYVEKITDYRWEKNIAPVLGQKKVQDWTAHDINRIFRTMKQATWEKRGRGRKAVLQTGSYSNSCQVQVRRLLNVLCKEAMKVHRGPIRRSNPMDGADLPEAKKAGPTAQAKVLLWETDVEQGLFRVLLDCPNSTPRVIARDYLVIWLLATTGMRISEILGLIWDDIDLEAGVIYLRQQLVYGAKASKQPDTTALRADLKWDKQEDAPKTRWLPVTPETLRLLRALKNAEIEAGRFPASTALVFSTSTLNPLGARSVHTRLAWAKTEAEVEKPVHPHALRHAYATHLYNTGTPMHEIQETLGHSDEKTTANYVTKLKNEAALERQREALRRARIR